MSTRHWTEVAEPDEEPDLLGQYLTQIARTPLLKPEEEVTLAQRIEAGVHARDRLDRAAAGELELADAERRTLEEQVRDGTHAKDHMVRANLRLVVSVAKRYGRRGMPLLDVIQEGNLGLMRAVEKFDYTKGFKFSTYATWWIRQSIQRGLALRGRSVRLPVHVVEELSKLGGAERKLQLRLGREPDLAELAAETDFAEEKIVRLRQVSRDVVSLDAPVGDDGETVVGDLIRDTEVLSASDVVEFKALAEELRAALGTLRPREAMILSMRYGLHDGSPHTLQEIANEVGLTRERIRQLEKKSLAELRASRRGGQLVDWAG